MPENASYVIASATCHLVLAVVSKFCPSPGDRPNFPQMMGTPKHLTQSRKKNP